MFGNTIESEIAKMEQLEQKNLQRLAFNLKKSLDQWSKIAIKPSWGDLKLSYWPVIFNIRLKGSTVSEISELSHITKQNMSRTIKELEERGIIESVRNTNDKRSDLLFLTQKGKAFVFEAHIEVFKMNQIYLEFIEERDLNTAFDVIRKITEYHQNLLTGYEIK